MIRCKITEGTATPCGTNMCCKYCEKKTTCGSACEEVFNPYDDSCPEEDLREEMTELQIMQYTVPEALETITSISIKMDQLKKLEEMYRQRILDAMERNGIKKFENDRVSFTYVAPTTRTSIDSTKLKKLHPEVAKECSKVTNVSASVRIAVK